MTLDTVLTDKQLRELAAKRQLERATRLVDSLGAIVGSVEQKVAQIQQLERDFRAFGSMPPPDCPVRIRRWANGCHVLITLPPRTKKNHGRAFGIKQSKAYKHYRDTIVNAVALWTARAHLPLEDRPYNIAVTYYVDKPGEQADKCGLDQGLYDALENAGVITDDWWFRTDDGSRIIAGDSNPRVEALITAIESSVEAPT